MNESIIDAARGAWPSIVENVKIAAAGLGLLAGLWLISAGVFLVM